MKTKMIPITERLPEEGQYVLIRIKKAYRLQYVPYYVCEVSKKWDGFVYFTEAEGECWQTWSEDKVDAWLPLKELDNILE